MSRIAVVLLSCVFVACAQDLREVPKRRSGLWKASVAALVAGSVADAHSSFGRIEANPILRGPAGRFNGRSLAIKAGITGAALGMQWLFLRRNPEGERWATRINFGMAGAFGGVAAYNHAIHRKPSLPLPRPSNPKPVVGVASFELPR